MNILRLFLFLFSLLFSSVLWMSGVLLISPLALLWPLPFIQRVMRISVAYFSRLWIFWQHSAVRCLLPINIQIEGGEDIEPTGRYLILSNHLSNCDIFILFCINTYKMPLIRCFAKRELLWVPFLNLGMYLTGFPLLRRYSQEKLAKNPALREKDMQTIKRSANFLSLSPFSLIHFCEGTRAHHAKRSKNPSPFKHLMAPRAGGLAIFLANLPTPLDAIYDVTLIYPDGEPCFLDFMMGKVKRATVKAQKVTLPATLSASNYEDDAAHRQAFKDWLYGIWAAKDKTIDDYLARAGQ